MTPLSDRAKARLKIAANFLRQRGIKFDDGNFYDSVISALENQPDREHLKGLVDWVEDYEKAEVNYYPASPEAGKKSRKTSQQRPA